MTKDQIDREFSYQTAKHLINLMLKNEIIDEEEYTKIDTKLLEKHRPLIGKLTYRKHLKIT